VHVGVTDRHGEDHSPNKLVRILFGRFGPQHGGEIGVAVAFVFVVGKNAEDLREILHVNAPAGGRAVETLDGQRVALGACGIFRQAVNFFDGNQSDCRYGDADGACQLQHDELIFGYGGELRGWQLDDPRSAHAVGGNGQPAGGLHHGGELELNSGEGKMQDAVLTVLVFSAGLVVTTGLGGSERCDGDRPGRSSPSVARRKNSRSALTPAGSAR
jgi:hypothetical protein